MKKIIILLSVILLGSASAGYATPITHNGIYTTSFNLSDWTFNGVDGPILSAKTLKAIQLWDFWNCKYAFLNADANNFLWKLNMRDVTLRTNALKDKKIKRKLVKAKKIIRKSPEAKKIFRKSLNALKELEILPIETSFEGDSFVALMTTGTSIDETTPSPVPEPAAILLFGTGLAGLAVATRRKLFHME